MNKNQILGPTFTMVGTPDYMAPEVREISWELDCDLDTVPPPEVKQFAPEKSMVGRRLIFPCFVFRGELC